VLKNGIGDRRVEKTRGSLHAALASLIHEKSYEDIVVKEILARANVGRSTFYTHFRDKDDLLDSSIRNVLGDAVVPAATNRAVERLVHFSLPVFEHIEQYRAAGGPMMDARAQAIVHERLERELVRLVANELERATQRQIVTGRTMPTDLLAQFVASTFIVVLNWWVACDRHVAAAEVNEAFRALILPTLQANLAERGRP
jgi:AcrR family transcriptional regulator